MEQEPLISVVIPVYNTAAYLDASIGSVRNQTYTRLEIIVVNDGSTDESAEVVERLMAEDARIEYFALPQNSGQSVARNEALKHVHGTYIYFMDSDDVLYPTALERCLERMLTAQLQLLFFDADILSEEGLGTYCFDYHRTKIYDDTMVYRGDVLFDSMLQHRTFRAVPWLYFVSADWLKRLQLTFYPGIIHEDELFTALLFLQSQRIGCLKESLLQHRIRGNSTITKHYSWRNVSCYLTVMDEMFRFVREGHPEHQGRMEYYARYTLNAVFQTAKVLTYKEKSIALKACIRKGYLRFLSLRTLLVFLLKRK